MGAVQRRAASATGPPPGAALIAASARGYGGGSAKLDKIIRYLYGKTTFASLAPPFLRLTVTTRGCGSVRHAPRGRRRWLGMNGLRADAAAPRRFPLRHGFFEYRMSLESIARGTPHCHGASGRSIEPQRGGGSADVRSPLQPTMRRALCMLVRCCCSLFAVAARSRRLCCSIHTNFCCWLLLAC